MKTPIFFCGVLCCLLHISASAVTYTVFNGIPGDEFKCGSDVTVQCKFSPAPAFITWKIAKDALTSTTVSATCFGAYCIKYAPDNYIFTYDQATNTSNVTIESVDFDEDGLQFFCNDSSSSQTLHTSKVTEILSVEETTVSKTREDNKIFFRIETNCVFPVDNSSFNVTWVRMKDGHTKSLEGQMSALQACINFTGCVANGSSKIIAEVNIPALDAGDQWEIGVSVKFQDYIEYFLYVGRYFYFSAKDADQPAGTGVPSIATGVTLARIIVVALVAIVFT